MIPGIDETTSVLARMGGSIWGLSGLPFYSWHL